jgi:poly(3-hydroxybutyrate) depolymerase
VTSWGSTGPVMIVIHGGPQGGPHGAEAFKNQKALADRGWQLVLPDRVLSENSAVCCREGRGDR